MQQRPSQWQYQGEERRRPQRDGDAPMSVQERKDEQEERRRQQQEKHHDQH